jgi:ribosomal protein S18 acetylase RimI-like enzyme
VNVVVRPGKERDVAYVIATWSRSYPHKGDRRQLVPHIRRAVLRCLFDQHSALAVACSSEDEDTLVGWALAEEGDLWWVYVAKDYRGMGLGSRLRDRVVQSKDRPSPSVQPAAQGNEST